jgi:hypothetical protein
MRSTGSIGTSVLALALSLAVAGAAAGDQQTIQGLNVEKTVTCDEREVAIYGGNHRLTLRGRCRKVSVHGTGHVVRVETLGRATVSGLDNRLEWERALNGDEPDIDITGVNNRAVRVEGTAARPPAGDAPAAAVSIQGDGSVTITGKDEGVVIAGGAGTVRVDPASTRPEDVVIEKGRLEQELDCGGGSAKIKSGYNRLTLRRCPELTINGGSNHVVLVGPVRVIRLLGRDNTVEWSEGEGGRPPLVETKGTGNKVMRR